MSNAVSRAQSWSVTDAGCPRHGNPSQCPQFCCSSKSTKSTVIQDQQHLAGQDRAVLGNTMGCPGSSADVVETHGDTFHLSMLLLLPCSSLGRLGTKGVILK
jgi:hypothetical protein